MSSQSESENNRRVVESLSELKELPLVADILRRLRTELSSELLYHTCAHTEDVLHEVTLFALHDRLSRRELELLGIAAAYHDSGFIVQREEHEQISAEIAVNALQSSAEFSSEESKIIEQLILDTKLLRTDSGLEQFPSTELSKYLLDADLSNLGRDDFFEKLDLVRQELDFEQSSFYPIAYRLISVHCWHSDAGRALRAEGEKQNLTKLQELIEQL